MISVCLATYNGEKYLRDQIDSILYQLGENDEIVVSDDGSTDATIEILNSYNDNRINIFYNEAPHGVNRNFENALKHAKGDYIFLSDQDDVWLPMKIEVCGKMLKEADCIVHDCIVTSGNLEVISLSLFNEINAGPGFYKNLKKNSFTGCCMAFTKDVLKKILPIPDSKLFYHDQWIGLIASLSFKTLFFKQQLIYFRRHNTNASSVADKSRQSFATKVVSRLAILKALIHRYVI